MSGLKEFLYNSAIKSQLLEITDDELVLDGGKYYTPKFQCLSDQFVVHVNFTGAYKILKCVDRAGTYSYLKDSEGADVSVVCAGVDEQSFTESKAGLWFKLELTAVSDIQILL